MEIQKITNTTSQDQIFIDGELLSRSALLEQLERIIESKHFRNSKRYPTFLKFVVEHTLAGKTEVLKERTLGVDVFARPSNYDTNADPVVRVTAGEIRKRIAQYYQEPNHGHELRIDLPLGSYVPHFLAGHTAPPAEDRVTSFLPDFPSGPSSLSAPELSPSEAYAIPQAETVVAGRRKPFILATLGVGILGITALLWFLAPQRIFQSGLRYAWENAIGSSNPVLVVLGVHSLDSRGREEQVASHITLAQPESKDMLASMVRSDMVPISDVVSYSRMTDLLTRHSHAYTTRGSADATLEELRIGPVMLIGGLDNLWTLRLGGKLRYHFVEGAEGGNEIVDSEHPATAWHFDNFQQAMVNTRDYAIVASYFDRSIDQPVLIAAGIGKAGTEVAAEFLTSDGKLDAWLRQAGASSGKNFEVVLSTEILDGKPGPPRVVASARW